jgi:hypothetical protein
METQGQYTSGYVRIRQHMSGYVSYVFSCSSRAQALALNNAHTHMCVCMIALGRPVVAQQVSLLLFIMNRESES